MQMLAHLKAVQFKKGQALAQERLRIEQRMEQMEADDEIQQAAQQLQFWENEVRLEEDGTEKQTVKDLPKQNSTAAAADVLERVHKSLPVRKVPPSINSISDAPDKSCPKADPTDLARFVQAITLAIYT